MCMSASTSPSFSEYSVCKARGAASSTGKPHFLKVALALTIMNNGCTEYQMPWWRGLRRIWSWRRPTVASPISGDHDPITGEPYYRMLPTDDGGQSYQMECLLCKAQGNILASRFLHEDNCPLRPTGK